MRRTLLAGAALLVSCSSAFAQVVIQTPGADVYVAPRGYAPPPSRYESHSYRSTPRVYEYTRTYDVDDADDDVVVVQRRYRADCGPYHRWNGDRCIYIRY